ncbi:MAG: F0F1 ATP synthase subunit B [Candidatus Bipolaricaulia bacterium]
MSFEWGKIVSSINWTLVFSLINFAILLYVLKRFLFKPAIAYLDKRREQIANRMESARESEEEAAALVEERSRELASARERSNQIVERAQGRSTEMIEEAKGKARGEADRIVADARVRMEQERDEMIRDLRAAYADIAILGVERILEREVKIDDHRKLLDQLVAEIDEEELKVRS